jgi:hypothetical protein
MSTVTEPLAFEMMMRPLSRSLSRELAEALINLQADGATQAHYDELADKRNQGHLTPAELEELEVLVRANTMLGLLKAEAMTVLAREQAA